MKLLLNCNSWLESIWKKEITKIWGKIIEVKDRLIFWEWWEEEIFKINLWSRIWNKVYIILDKKKVKTFDELFQLVNKIDWNKYIKKWQKILVNADSIKSKLTHTPSIQSISKKAIISKITNGVNFKLEEDENKWKVEIQIVINKDIAQVMINTSGKSLHKRWYNIEWHPASLKENISSAISILSNWSFEDKFIDWFCGSWTILIEACLLWLNIAPWLFRKFDFEKFKWINTEKYKQIKEEIKNSRIDRNLKIEWIDIDKKYLDIAEQKMKKVWLDRYISLKNINFQEYKFESDKNYHIVSNPPYWERLEQINLESIYSYLRELFESNENIKWWIFTGFEEFDNMIDKDYWKLRKLYNWQIKCYFYKKIK